MSTDKISAAELNLERMPLIVLHALEGGATSSGDGHKLKGT